MKAWRMWTSTDSSSRYKCVYQIIVDYVYMLYNSVHVVKNWIPYLFIDYELLGLEDKGNWESN